MGTAKADTTTREMKRRNLKNWVSRATLRDDCTLQARTVCSSTQLEYMNTARIHELDDCSRERIMARNNIVKKTITNGI